MLVCLSFTSYARTARDSIQEMQYDLCMGVGRLGFDVMVNRQSGLGTAQMLRIIHGSGGNEKAINIAHHLVLHAVRYDIQDKLEDKKQASEDFAHDMFALCLNDGLFIIESTADSPII